MQASDRTLIRQPFVGAAAVVAGLATVTTVWPHGDFAWLTFDSATPILLGVILASALVGVRMFPIHIHQSTKIEMSSILVYLIAVLLPPPIAGIAAFAGTLTGDLVVRKQRDLYPSDIASQVGRLTIIAALGSVVAHLPPHDGAAHALPLFGAAFALWLGDFVTSPFVLTPITGESARTVIATVVKEGSLTEAAQYLIGILGAIAAEQQLWSLILLIVPAVLIYLTTKHNKELQDDTTMLLEYLADTVDLRDPYTGGHSRRVTEYVRGILRELGLHGPDVNLIIVSARVHDIGKIAMPDHVLLKEGKLNDEEWAIMKEHPEKGADLFMRSPDFSRGAGIVRHHHEAWNGEGYPYRLREYDIPFGARVIAVADSYDAMTSDRPYRKGMAPDKAASILREGRGRQWDGAIVDAFLRSIEDRLEQPIAPILRLIPQTENAPSITA